MVACTALGESVMPSSGGIPSPTNYLSVESHSESLIRLAVRGSGLGLVPIVIIAVLLGTIFFSSPWPLVLCASLPFLNTVTRWSFCRNGPTINKTMSFWGISLRTRSFPLSKGDCAYSNVIADSPLAVYRPRWYKVKLRVRSRRRDWTIIRSNDKDDLARMVALLNDSIRFAIGDSDS